MIERRLHMKRFFTIGFGILAGVILLFSVIFYVRSNRPMAKAEKEAVAIARKYADFDQVDQFYWYTREETYFGLTGTNKKGQEIVVIIPKSGEKVTVFNQSDGLTEAKALRKVIDTYKPADIIKITLGMYKDEPVWEVTARNKDDLLNYYLISFKTGEPVKVIENI